MGRGKSGASRISLADHRGGLVGLPLVQQQVAEVRIAEGVSRRKPDRLAERGGRLVRLAVGTQGEAEAVGDRGVVGLEPLRLAELAEGLVPFAHVQLGGRQQEVGRAELRSQGDGRHEVRLGALIAFVGDTPAGDPRAGRTEARPRPLEECQAQLRIEPVVAGVDALGTPEDLEGPGRGRRPSRGHVRAARGRPVPVGRARGRRRADGAGRGRRGQGVAEGDAPGVGVGDAGRGQQATGGGRVVAAGRRGGRGRGGRRPRYRGRRPRPGRRSGAVRPAVGRWASGSVVGCVRSNPARRTPRQTRRRPCRR